MAMSCPRSLPKAMLIFIQSRPIPLCISYSTGRASLFSFFAFPTNGS